MEKTLKGVVNIFVTKRKICVILEDLVSLIAREIFGFLKNRTDMIIRKIAKATFLTLSGLVILPYS